MINNIIENYDLEKEITMKLITDFIDQSKKDNCYQIVCSIIFKHDIWTIYVLNTLTNVTYTKAIRSNQIYNFALQVINFVKEIQEHIYSKHPLKQFYDGWYFYKTYNGLIDADCFKITYK